MPLIMGRPNRGRTDLLIVLGSENIERMQDKDPFELKCWELPYRDPIGVIQIAYATDAEMTQYEQLVRQGKVSEVIKQLSSGWAYHPEKGDHDRGPERLS